MSMCKHLLFIGFLLLGFVTKAQNKKHDWSAGVNSAIYSHSAILEKKITNPYEYTIGANVTVSRYLNNHLDLTLQGNRTKINYPVAVKGGEPVKYTKTELYGANFTLKYKIDNGYILKEHTMFAPYVILGGGAYMTTLFPDISYVTPLGLGLTVNLGNRTSLIFESQYNYAFRNALPYMQYNMGLRVHFGKANKKRLKATRRREKERRYAKIRKYRAEQRLVKAQKAKARLEKMKQRGLVANMMTMEEDSDLLETETIVLNPTDAPIVVDISEAPTKPKQATVTKETNSHTIVIPPIEPVIPESPGRDVATETTTVLPESKPPLAKPNSNRTENIITNRVEEQEEVSVVKPKKEVIEVTETTPIASKPIVEPTIVEEETKPVIKPTIVEDSSMVEPQKIIEATPIKETVDLCKNSEVELSKIGENINFDSDRYRIRSRMRKELDKITEILKECEDNSYVIIAHTDSDGNDKYNRKLATNRANAVKKYLMDQGIDGNRLITIAYGASVPIAPNTSSDNKAKNRRIEFRLNRTSFDE